MAFKRILRKIRNISNLFFIFFALIVMFLIFNKYSSQIPLIIVSLVLAGELIFFEICGRRIRIAVTFSSIYETKDNPVRYRININKRSIYPFKYIDVYIKYRSKYDNKTQKNKLTIFLRDSISQSNTFVINGLPCGYTEFFVEKAYVYDMFGMADIRLKKEPIKSTVLVMPTAKPINIDLPQIPYISGDETEIFSSELKEDNNELVEIREFRDGDSLNKIHWKLSSKSDELIVRDSVMSIETNIYVFVELWKNINLNDMFEKAISTAYELRSLGYAFYITWFDKSRNNLVRRLISEYEQIDKTIAEIMYCDVYEKDKDVITVLNRFMNENHEVYNLFILS